MVTKSALPFSGLVCELTSSWNVPSGLEGWDLGCLQEEEENTPHTLTTPLWEHNGQTKSLTLICLVGSRIQEGRLKVFMNQG